MDLWLVGGGATLLLGALATGYMRFADVQARYPGATWVQTGVVPVGRALFGPGARVVEARSYGSVWALVGAGLLLLLLGAGSERPSVALLALAALVCGTLAARAWLRLRRLHVAWFSWALPAVLALIGAVATVAARLP